MKYALAEYHVEGELERGEGGVGGTQVRKPPANCRVKCISNTSTFTVEISGNYIYGASQNLLPAPDMPRKKTFLLPAPGL